MSEPQELTAKQRTEKLVGPCGAVTCPRGCDFFAYDYTQDSFRICLCGHTQQAHAEGDKS